MKQVVTISCEFGSGGGTIAKEASPSKNFSAYVCVWGGGRDASGSSVGDYLWRSRKNLMEKLAEEGNCVPDSGVLGEKRCVKLSVDLAGEL